MSHSIVSFAGLISRSGEPLHRRQEELLVRALVRGGNPRDVQLQRQGPAVFAAVGAKPESGRLFISSSRLDNGAAMARDLGLSGAPNEQAILQKSFSLRGDAGLAAVLGTFALADWDGSTLTLARDVLGWMSLFYHAGREFVAFATHIATLLALPDVPRVLDERLLANFLALNHREKDITFYKEVLRVPSRSVVRITRDGIDRHAYWAPDLSARLPDSDPREIVARARELFDVATQRTLHDAPRIALHLSGGFDSSAIAATAAKLGHDALWCYTGVPPDGFVGAERRGRYLSERDKVEALQRLHPSLKIKFVAPRGAHWNQSNPARLFASLPYAMRNTCNLGWFAQIDDVIEDDGHSVLLHGSLGNMTLSWDGSFSLAELLQQGRLIRLWRDGRAIARKSKRNFAKVLVKDGLFPLLPPELQRAFHRLRGREGEDISGFSLLNPDAIADLDLRAQWRDDGFDPTYSSRGSSAQLRAHQIFDQLQMSRDIVGMQQQNENRDIRSPYDDRELIEFCLAIPDTLFRYRGEPRWFARQVFADRLPPEILNETRRGEQAPNWFESLDARKTIIAEEIDRIAGSRLASRLIDVPRLKRLVADWPKDLHEAHAREAEYRLGLDRAIHAAKFIRWVEGGNA